MIVDGDKLLKLVTLIDGDLAAEGMTVPQRPSHALRRVAMEIKLPLPFTEPPKGFEHESVQYWPISKAVYDWYDRRYGDGIKMDFCPGLLAISIRHDIYIARMPLFFGRLRVIAAREHIPTPALSKTGPVLFNAVDSMDSLPATVRLELTDSELSHVRQLCSVAVNVIHALDKLRFSNPLVRMALSDNDSAATHLMDSKREYALSKWSSLQAAEKMLKFAIQEAGGIIRYTHTLSELLNQAKESGLSIPATKYAEEIQCSPAVRYGGEAISEEEALRAHHAFFSLAHMTLSALRGRT